MSLRPVASANRRRPARLPTPKPRQIHPPHNNDNNTLHTTKQIVGHAAEYLALQAARGALPGVVAVPSCAAAAAEAAFHGLAVSNLGDHPKVDVLLEQVDQIDVQENAFLKGIRAEPVQPDLPGLVGLVGASARVVALAAAGDAVPRLCASLPVAIDADRWEEVAEELDDIFLGDAEVWRRPAEGTANPRGGHNPYVSPDGDHAIVDLRFYEGLKLFGEPEKVRGAGETFAVLCCCLCLCVLCCCIRDRGARESALVRVRTRTHTDARKRTLQTNENK